MMLVSWYTLEAVGYLSTQHEMLAVLLIVPLTGPDVHEVRGQVSLGSLYDLADCTLPAYVVLCICLHGVGSSNDARMTHAAIPCRFACTTRMVEGLR